MSDNLMEFGVKGNASACLSKAVQGLDDNSSEKTKKAAEGPGGLTDNRYDE